ncbi:MAG: hypothetical protein J6M66_07775 [Lachnospiraceae bacterium]|nr:hypothetical protein [Lachnospiraceae bacterium]
MEIIMMKRKKEFGLRKTVRKMLSAAAAAALVLAMGVTPALAEPADPGPGSIKLTLEYKDENNQVQPMKDGEIALYTVATVTGEEGSRRYNLSGGQFADVTDPDVQEIPNLTQEQMNDDVRMHNLSDKIAKNYLEGRTPRTTVIQNGSASITGLYPGLYLIVNSKAATDLVTFTPFLITLPDEENQYQLEARPKPGVVKEEPDNPNPPVPGTTESVPETTEPVPGTTEPSRSNGGGGGGGGRTPRREPPAQTTPETEPSVLGAIRDNGEQVLGAIRNPGQVLGAVRTGDPSAIFICGEILVLASAMLMGWICVFRKFRRNRD